MFGFLFIVVQFGGLFWFLSRGGIDTYMPDDLETRFSDVKGQDPVLERVQENMIFLDDPESIEERGGYVPGRPAALGSAGNGQDADGAGGGRRDGEAVRVRRSRRVRPDVHGRGHPEGEEPVPEAPQARRALRRRDRVLRRGRLAGQPRIARRSGRRLEHRVRRAVRRWIPAATACPTSRPPTRDALVRSEMGATKDADHHGRHGRRRRDGHAPGAAVRDVGAEEAARVRQPARATAARV